MEKTIKGEKQMEESIKQFIVNNLGINLCSVKEIKVKKQTDEQLISIHIDFIPNKKE